MARFRFWVRDKDSKGEPIDDVIRKTAESIAPKLIHYRQREIGSEQTSNEILQSAVEAASRAKQRSHIENPSGYLARIYKRLVDKFLDRERKLISLDDEALEDLPNAGQAQSFEDAIHNRLLLEKLLNAMDEETRQICTWRLEGYSESEIAKLLKTTPNAVSVRYTRGLKKAVELCFKDNRKDKARRNA
jgi:RNA polymerase sigma factor (sigma-70 family)